MATRFECQLEGGDPARLRAAGEALLDDVVRTERSLSFYDPGSDLSRLNAAAGTGPVPVSALLLRALSASDTVVKASGGAFDPVVGTLMSAWGVTGHLDPARRQPAGREPTRNELEEARTLAGWHHVALDPSAGTVTLDRPGTRIDLGGIGKGVALDEARWTAEELGLERVLLHGGTSSVLAVGGPWDIGIARPDDEEDLLEVITLENAALGVSSPYGKVAATGRGHILDIRTGEPITAYRVAAVVARSAAIADGWATALTVRPDAGPPPDGVLQQCVFERAPDGAWTRQ